MCFWKLSLYYASRGTNLSQFPLFYLGFDTAIKVFSIRNSCSYQLNKLFAKIEIANENKNVLDIFL